MDVDFWMAIGAGALMVSAVAWWLVVEWMEAGK